MEMKSYHAVKTYQQARLKGHWFNGYPPKALSSGLTAINLNTWSGAQNKWIPWNEK